MDMLSDEAINALFWKRVSEIRAQHVIATLVYFFTCVVFNVPLWKSFIVAGIVAYCLFIRFGRGLLVRLAVILLVIVLTEWSGAVGHLSDWVSVARDAISRNSAGS